MAMLAEPRRKQKWTLNPRGKQWSDDTNKFGQKMLEKMGWSRGKGLGANEQGMTEHVKVGFKNDQAGIGYKDNGDQWTQHQIDFNEFLSQLQTDGGPEVKPNSKEGELSGKSLEVKSKLSRARVHYHKFTRGKDVNKYSAKDLATILGKKDPIAKISAESINTPTEITEPIGSKDNTGGVLTIKGGNISDYFKNKLPIFVKKHNGEVNAEDNFYDSETEQRVGFGFNNIKQEIELSQCEEEKNKFVFENPALDFNSPGKEQSMPKKRKSEFVFENPGLDLDYPEKPKRSKSISLKTITITDDSNTSIHDKGFVNIALNLDTPADDTCNGIEFEVSRVAFGVDNNALDITDETNTKKRVTFNNKVEYSTDQVEKEKKKKKKKKAKRKLDKFEVENENSKKKERIENLEQTPDETIGFVNEALDIEILSEEINDNEVNERKGKKAQRKKERRMSNLETIQEAPEEDREVDNVNVEMNQIIVSESEIINVEEAETPKQKKKKKKDKEEAVAPVIMLVDNEPGIEFSKKKKKKKDKKPEVESFVEEMLKKKKKEPKVDTTTEEGKENLEKLPEDILEVDVKKKEKKSRKFIGDATAADSISLENEELNESRKNTKRKRESTEHVERPSKRDETEEFQGEVTNLELKCNIHSPWNRHRKNKKIVKSFFARSPILHFNGSNINEIKGYGADIK
ncbi:myosin-2 heavy chain [Cephus cinctus]|uniref:Myosin-2 heavy chain n=1 Tax=Cephus cinctus TaxID=211228 RepID=A0AAJ7BZF0_CEPCN|nr:myosin-2 heavy chain [Cephus cinctus]